VLYAVLIRDMFVVAGPTSSETDKDNKPGVTFPQYGPAMAIYRWDSNIPIYRLY
jgi:hypothetical protein